MCERIKKAEAALEKYRQRAESVHHLAEMVGKDVEKLKDQLLVIQIVYMVASALAVNDFENHHLQQDKVRAAQKQENEKTFIQPKTNGNGGMKFF